MARSQRQLEIDMDFDENGKVLPFAELRSELFNPTRLDIRQTKVLATQLAEEAATVFLLEFRNESKATAGYLSSIRGKNSCGEISEEVRKAGMGKSASNSISERAHAGLTQRIEVAGLVRSTTTIP